MTEVLLCHLFPISVYFYYVGGVRSHHLILAILINLWWEGAQKIEPGASYGMQRKFKKQWAQIGIQEILFHSRKKFSYTFKVFTLEQIAQKHCGFCILEDTQNPATHVPRQTCLNREFDCRWSVDIHSNIIYSVILPRDLYPVLVRILQSLPELLSSCREKNPVRELSVQRATAVITLLMHVTQTAGCTVELQAKLSR